MQILALPDGLRKPSERVVWPTPQGGRNSQVENHCFKSFLFFFFYYFSILMKIFKRFIYFMFMSTLSFSSDTQEEGIKSNYRWLWATTWLLAIELRNSGRAASAVNCWAISPSSIMKTFKQLKQRQKQSSKKATSTLIFCYIFLTCFWLE